MSEHNARPTSLASLFDEPAPANAEPPGSAATPRPEAELVVAGWARNDQAGSQLTHPLPAKHPAALNDDALAFFPAYSRLHDEGEGEEPERAQRKAPRLLRVVEAARGVLPDTRDVLAASTVFLTAISCSMVCADTLFDTDKLRANWPVVVQMCCLGVATSGLLLLALSHVIPSPTQDLFPLPFFLPMVVFLHEEISDPHELYNTTVVLLLVSHLVLGSVLWLSGRGRLLRVADYIPYPVVCGLLGGLGVALVFMSINLVLRNSEMIAARMVCVVLFAVAAAYATSHDPQIWLPLLFVLVPAGLRLATSVTNTDSAPWLYHKQLNSHLSAEVFVFSFDFRAVRWWVLLQLWPNVMALTVMYTLKTAMFFPAFERMMKRKIDAKREMRTMGIVLTTVGALGLIPGIIGPGQIAMLTQISGVSRRAGAIVTFLFFLSALTPLLYVLLAVMPKFMFLGLPLANGFILINHWVVQSRHKLPRNEWAVVIAIVCVGTFSSLVVAVCVGAVFAVFLFVVSVHNAGCIKVHASALTVRSSVDRMLEEKDYLDQHGDRIQVVQLQGYLFFGNATTILTHIESTFPHLPSFSHGQVSIVQKATDSNLQSSLPAQQRGSKQLPPTFLIFDMPLVLGLDASAAEVLAQVKDIPCMANCTVLFALWEPEIAKALLLRPEFHTSQIYADIDTALEWCEEKVLRPVEWIHRQIAMRQAELGDKGGFARYLRLAEGKFGELAAELVELEQFVSPIELQKGDVLMNQQAGTRVDMRRGGLFFIEHGSISIQRDPQQSLTLQSKLLQLKGNRVQHRVHTRNFRLTRVGAGWIIGASELCSGFRSVGTYVAECPTRVFFLPFSTVGRITSERPVLALRLYRLLARLVTEKADRNTEQLSHLMDWLYSHPSHLERETIKGIV